MGYFLRKFKTLISFVGISASISSQAWAYNNFSHDRITRHAIRYLTTHRATSEAAQSWRLLTSEQWALMKEALVRSAVDADYRTDLWFESCFHRPSVGTLKDSIMHTFTSVYHFINIAQPGQYWNHDGYSFRQSTLHGKDKYFAAPTLTVRSNLSFPLSGESENPTGIFHNLLGMYNSGFRGSNLVWRELYSAEAPTKNVVFPPANIPADLAYESMLASDRAKANSKQVWYENLPLITGLVSSQDFRRKFLRIEVAGLPKRLDQLGLTMHLMQDMTVPHHTLGTMGLCHEEYEDFADQLSCQRRSTKIDYSTYDRGTYSGDMNPQCTQLYDEGWVAHFLETLDFLKADRTMSISERMQSLAALTSKWKWAYNKLDHSHISTTLPSGSSYRSRQCSNLFEKAQIQSQMKYQYNLAIAATVAVFDIAANRFEKPFDVE